MKCYKKLWRLIRSIWECGILEVDGEHGKRLYWCDTKEDVGRILKEIEGAE